MEILRLIYEKYGIFLTRDDLLWLRFLIALVLILWFANASYGYNFHDFKKDIIHTIFILFTALVFSVIPVIWLVLPILGSFYAGYIVILKFCRFIISFFKPQKYPERDKT